MARQIVNLEKLTEAQEAADAAVEAAQAAADKVAGAISIVEPDRSIPRAYEPPTFEVAAAFRREFRMAAADRGIRLNALLADAFEAWKAQA